MNKTTLILLVSAIALLIVLAGCTQQQGGAPSTGEAAEKITSKEGATDALVEIGTDTQAIGDSLKELDDQLSGKS
ncbi:MAG: hypothetical protein AB1467_05045 [Candidatus Diapherotrites archaeon]